MLKRKTNILSKNKSSGVKISENLLITFIAVMLATTVGCRKNESNASDSNIRYDEGSVVTETVTASEAMQTDEAAVSEAGAKAAQSYEQVPSTEPKPNTSVWEADKKPESKASALPANNNPEPLPETKPETPKRATAADTGICRADVFQHGRRGKCLCSGLEDSWKARKRTIAKSFKPD